MPETLDDLYRAFLEICSNGSIGEDNDGQIVFYTNKRIDRNKLGLGETIIEFEEDSDEAN